MNSGRFALPAMLQQLSTDIPAALFLQDCLCSLTWPLVKLTNWNIEATWHQMGQHCTGHGFSFVPWCLRNWWSHATAFLSIAVHSSWPSGMRQAAPLESPHVTIGERRWKLLILNVWPVLSSESSKMMRLPSHEEQSHVAQLCLKWHVSCPWVFLWRRDTTPRQKIGYFNL